MIRQHSDGTPCAGDNCAWKNDGGHVVTTNQAPLAQLRQQNEDAWKLVMQLGTTREPDDATTMHAMSAALLGDTALALEILQVGFHGLLVQRSGDWPVLLRQ